LALPIADGHELHAIVADNNSTDATPQTMDRYRARFAGRVEYVKADRGQGRSFALNAGILASRAELVGFIDDDEEVDSRWAEVIWQTFSDPAVDYIGGRYEPVWEVEPPAWVNHPHTRTAIGWADFGDQPRSFEDDSFDGLPLGGNVVLRRACFDRVGLYSEVLGRKGKRLLAGEDMEMHERLKGAGFHGVYVPSLVIYHHIPAHRVTKKYMRQWAFWASVSISHMMIEHPRAGPRWFRLPRNAYRKLLGAPFQWVKSAVGGSPAEAFHHELALWRFAGLFYGMHRFRPEVVLRSDDR
jgi:glucosyl-dolichyl phosphate glucuronosyltransferase